MLQYMETDIYKQELSKQATEGRVLRSIWRSISTGNVSPDLEKSIVRYEGIAHHVEELKKKNRGSDALLEKGIQSYKDGRIIIFDGELTSYDQYKLPSYLMFLPIKDKLLFNINGLKKANWKKVSSDEYEYVFSNVMVELKFILVTAQIIYEILINGKEKTLINDAKLMPLVTQIYVDFFKKAVGRSGAGLDDVDIDKVNYIISKFFYTHTLQFSEKEAEKIVTNMYKYMDYEISDIKLTEELIDYSNFFAFVPSLTKSLFKKELSGLTLVNLWANTFGASVFTSLEYFPSFLTHILVLIFGVEFVSGRYDLRSKKDAVYQRLTVILK